MGGYVRFPVNSIVGVKDYPLEYSHRCMNYLKDTYGLEELVRTGRFSISNVASKRYVALLLPPDKLLAKLKESVTKVNDQVRVDYTLSTMGADVTVSSDVMTDIHREYWKGMLLEIYDMTKIKGSVEIVNFKEGDSSIKYEIVWK